MARTTTRVVPICDDLEGRHAWTAPFEDGDTCSCGRFYLDRDPVPGIALALIEILADAEEE